MKRTYSQIDMDERRKIARWRTAGISVDVIAEKLRRHRSTIFRELRRNTFEDREMPDLNGYYCVMANDMARERRAKLRKGAFCFYFRRLSNCGWQLTPERRGENGSSPPLGTKHPPHPHAAA